MILAKSRWYFRNSRSQISRPKSTERSRASALTHWRIFVRAREVFTNFNQSLLGWWPVAVVISMVSPFLSW